MLGLAKLVCRERGDCTYPGDPGGRIKKLQRPACPVTTPRTKDAEWIPVVAARGWVIITRDRAIQANRAEIDSVRANDAKMINLASVDAGSTWTQLEVLMTRWREIEAFTDQRGPFIYIATRTGRLRKVDIAA